MERSHKGMAAALAAAVVVVGTSVAPAPSYAGDGGAVALGALGGLAAGAMLGGALSGPRYYAPPPPPPTYRAYYPAYAPVYEECVRHRVWGPYGWHWVRYCD